MKNPLLRIFSVLSVCLLTILLASGCKKTTTTTATVTIPTVTTPTTVVNLTSTTAQSGGIITSNGGDVILANGVCYSTTNMTPTISDTKTSDSVSTAGTTTINFTSKLNGLTPNTLYYLRAYATNSAGVGYGSVITFTTPANLSALIGTVTTLAGNGNPGFMDGVGTNALFNSPQGIAVDSKNNVYVSDAFNNAIRQITPGGLVTTIAGNGTAGYVNGANSIAEFYNPTGLAVDGAGNIFVADLGVNVIRLISGNKVSTFAGNVAHGYVDGSGATVEFNAATGLAVDGQGNVYVADKDNNIIRKITSAGSVGTFAGLHAPGYYNGTGTGASFTFPSAIAIDANGNLYVADQGNYAIRKITSAGVVTTLVGGPSQPALLNSPNGVAVDKNGNVFISDGGGRILEYTTTGFLYVVAGSLNNTGFANGVGAAAKFNSPNGLAVDANGVVYVADQNNNCIRKITITLVH